MEPRALPDPAVFVRWYEVIATVVVAGVVGGSAAWLVAKWRRWT